MFLHRAIEVAINRGHSKITQEDLLKAEASYSEDMLAALRFELKDVDQDYDEILFQFLRCPVRMTEHAVRQLLDAGGLLTNECSKALEMLVWFGFLGVQAVGEDEPQFSYQVRYNLPKLLAPMTSPAYGHYVVHPAFRGALDCLDTN
jgi:hypothetical protein